MLKKCFLTCNQEQPVDFGLLHIWQWLHTWHWWQLSAECSAFWHPLAYVVILYSACQPSSEGYRVHQQHCHAVGGNLNSPVLTYYNSIICNKSECVSKWLLLCIYLWFYIYIYTGCSRRNGPNFGRVFLMSNYTDITQNTYIQSWTVTEIMAREKCGHLAFPRTVCLQLCSTLTVREQCGTHFSDGTSSAQRDKIAFHYCWYVQCLVTLRTTVTWVRVFL